MDAKTKILIVEDESIVALEIRDRLLKMGYSVPVAVNSGDLAIQKTKEIHPDLILMDIIIKGNKDGIETAGLINEKYDIPIIFLTAHSDTKTLQRAAEKTPYGYILKPFKERELQITIEMSLQRHKLELELKNNKKWLSIILSSIGEGLVATGPDEIIEYLNPVAEKLINVNQGDVLNKHISEIIRFSCAKTKKKFGDLRDIYKYQKENPQFLQNVQLSAQNGHTLPIDFTISPIGGENDTLKGFVFIFRDISEKKKMQEELIKAQKLESLGVLAGGIAHNFNNILTAILGNISLVKMTSKSSHETEEMLKEAEKATFRAQKLSNQLLTFSKGGSPFKEETDMNKFIHKSVDFALQGSPIRGRFNLQPDLWKAEIDIDQFGQVFTNLTLNAIYSMPDGGQVWIASENLYGKEAKEIKTAQLSSGNYIKIIIRDEGIGIPPENIKKIFDPFFTTNTLGRGLGLSAVYSIIEKHGGCITVDSRVDEGSVFTVYLPATVESVVTNTTRNFDVQLSGCALVVDDEEAVRNITGEFLKRCGMEVCFAEEGKEAIGLFKQNYEKGKPFDVVVLDLTIPGSMGGKEILSALLKIDVNVKAVVSSGYSNDPVLTDYSKYGFKGKAVKPFSFKSFISIIKNVLDEK
ncbi:MAG: response regulator [Thermodesulfobacteriota bacterium]|nr:response regulator [Thermodesulfobacteriota bacterium]